MEIQEVFRANPGLEEKLEKVMWAEQDKYRAYTRCKRLAEDHVGFWAKRKELRTQEAYLAVIDYLCGRLKL